MSMVLLWLTAAALASLGGWLASSVVKAGAGGCLIPVLTILGIVAIGGSEQDVELALFLFTIFVIGPSIGAAVGWSKADRDKRDLEERQTQARVSIPTTAKRIGCLWYRGGGPSAFKALAVDLFATDSAVWLAPVGTAAQPLELSADDIADIAVIDAPSIQTRTDVLGGILWGGGGSRRTDSSRNPFVVITWQPQSTSRPFHLELGASSPIADEHEKTRQALGLHVQEIRQVHARFAEALGPRVPNSAQDNETQSLVSPGLSSDEFGNYLPCPWCAEPVRDTARVCRHCQRELATGKVV
jgi:hypothetical protein